MTHGTRSCYVHGCRETACREANNRYQREKSGERNKLLAEGLGPTAHNSSTYKNWGCRCEDCKKGNREALREYRKSIKIAVERIRNG
jgi:hypothetical protein